jgi:hypothetical protein
MSWEASLSPHHRADDGGVSIVTRDVAMLTHFPRNAAALVSHFTHVVPIETALVDTATGWLGHTTGEISAWTTFNRYFTALKSASTRSSRNKGHLIHHAAGLISAEATSSRNFTTFISNGTTSSRI